MNIKKTRNSYVCKCQYKNDQNVENKKAPHYKRLKDMEIDNYSSVFTQEEDDE